MTRLKYDDRLRQITFTTDDGPITAPVKWISDNFAIHRAYLGKSIGLSRRPHDWRLTHIGSGLRAASGPLALLKLKAAAFERCGVDWGFEGTSPPGGFPDACLAISRAQSAERLDEIMRAITTAGQLTTG